MGFISSPSSAAVGVEGVEGFETIDDGPVEEVVLWEELINPRKS